MEDKYSLYFILILIVGIVLIITKVVLTLCANGYIRKHGEELFEANSDLSYNLVKTVAVIVNNQNKYYDCLYSLGLMQRVDCSSSVVSNAEKNPLKFVIKYSDITNDIETLEMLDVCVKYAKALEYFHKGMRELESRVESQIPVIWAWASTPGNIPYVVCNISFDLRNYEVPDFVFSYISPAGKSQRRYSIQLNSDLMQSILFEVSGKVTKSERIKTQRNAMTRDLRDAIKKRDNYTCCICGNSVYQEPNLLLEIDHIIPVSKGGKTEANNLQTLCWRCNREKSNSCEKV